MTSREIIQRVLSRDNPPRIGFAFSPYRGRERLNDTAGAGAAASSGFEEKRWVDGSMEYWVDEFGSTWRRVIGVTVGGEVFRGALEDWSGLDHYQLPDLDDPQRYAGARDAFAASERYRLGSLPGYPFNVARYIRRLENYLADCASEPDLVWELNDRVAKLLGRVIAIYADCGADGVFLCEDWGTQDRLLVHPDMWRKLFRPHFEELNAIAHSHGLTVWMHSCGCVSDIIGDLIETGIDVLQFDQPELHGIEWLAQRFHDRVTFFCPVDIQRTLQTGDRQQIQDTARNMVRLLGAGGGFIAKDYGDTHSIGVGEEWQQWAYEAFLEAGTFGQQEDRAMAVAGTAVTDLDTPALIVDLDLFERNLDAMAAFFRDRSCGLRPHFKAHRTPEISRRQLAAGAVGITCAKLAEAEHLVDEGLTNVLLANEIAGEAKVGRLVELSKRADVIAAVDCRQTAAAISARAAHEGVRVGVLVDLDIGMGRCGCVPGAPAAELVRTVSEMPGLRLRGLMGYEGHLQLRPPGPEKDRLVAEAIGKLLETKTLVERDGIEVEVVSAGGTGTAFLTGAIAGVTEIQAGSYCLMDSIYSAVAPHFEQAVWVLATVMSRPTPTRAITDAGLKSLHPLGRVPAVKSPAGVTLTALHAEHGVCDVADGASALRVGDKVEVYVRYLDGTMNLHERVFAVRGDVVEDVWAVSGRGRSR